jgi:hypothetical protein
MTPMPIGQATGCSGELAGEAFSLGIAAWLYALPLDKNYLGEKALSPAPKRSLFFGTHPERGESRSEALARWKKID